MVVLRRTLKEMMSAVELLSWSYGIMAVRQLGCWSCYQRTRFLSVRVSRQGFVLQANPTLRSEGSSLVAAAVRQSPMRSYVQVPVEVAVVVLHSMMACAGSFEES